MSFIYKNEKGQSLNLTCDGIRLLKFSDMSSLDNDVKYNSNTRNIGATFISNKLEPKDITLTLLIDVNPKSFEYTKRKLMNVFNPNTKGAIILKSQNGDKKIDVIVTSSPKFTPKSYAYKQEVSIRFIALDPTWKDIEKTKTEIALWKGSFMFPLIIPIDEGIKMGYREPSLIANVNNTGDIITGMKIEFKALNTVDTPQLINVETQQFIKINKVMNAGEIITVTTDYANEKVYCNENNVVTNGFKYWDLYSTFLQLEIGDNLFRYDAKEGLDNLEVTINHTTKYIGV